MDKGGGEEGEGEMNGDSSMDAYTPIYVNNSKWGFVVSLRELNQGSVIT